ncbi:MAG: hypothetical protein CFK52_07245 [Chloracidobacterium sp. CP2_5A]|nr:MAG: hypothetical protein CFK52_07245 [Chloracidobacterium sp. CP2_5A]
MMAGLILGAMGRAAALPASPRRYPQPGYGYPACAVPVADASWSRFRRCRALVATWPRRMTAFGNKF